MTTEQELIKEIETAVKISSDKTINNFKLRKILEKLKYDNWTTKSCRKTIR